MNVGTIQKRVIIKRTLFIIFCIYIGWFLKARLTPPNLAAMMGAGASEPYVLVQPSVEKDLSDAKEYIGSVEAINAVDLRPQINGYVEKVLFQEGSIVNQGDILFVIEQDRYLATLNLREAELSKAKALLTRVSKDHKRQVSLNKQKYTSESQLDNALSDLQQAQAAVKQAEANLELAKIDVNYTEIKAPFTGHIGKALVTEGNYVSSATQVLARIIQLNPVQVAFSMNDKDFLNFREKLQSAGNASLRIRLKLPNGKILENKLLRHFTDNEVNVETATIAAYAEFDNSNNMLIPGNFVTVLIGGQSVNKSVMIPQSAIGQDEHGNFAMVVNKDNIVEEKRITLGGPIGNMQIVTEGVKKGENVIVQGLQKAKNGQKVKTGEVK